MTNGTQKRRDIRRTAAHMIARQGALRTTVNGLTLALGICERNFYDHYSMREELYADILLEHLNLLDRRVRAAFDLAHDAPPVERLAAMASAWLGFALEDRDEHRLVLRLSDLLDASDRARVRNITLRLADLFAAALLAAEPDAIETKVAALSLLSMLSCAALWFRADGDIDVAAYARMLTDMALAGVGSLRALPRDFVWDGPAQGARAVRAYLKGMPFSRHP